MKVKTADLTGPPLDWAVASCEYPDNTGMSATHVWRIVHGRECSFLISPYHRSWTFGGPIIERHPIQVGRASDREGFQAFSQNGVNQWSFGPTPLIAAMRCYVASKLGDEVDVPEELL